MANTRVTFDTDVNNARSESAIAINPNNPQQMVASSKRFNNIHTYDFTLGVEWSDDGGANWHEAGPLALSSGATVMTDPTIAWDDVGNVFLVGLSGYNPPTWPTLGIDIYKSTDGGKHWSAPNRIHTSGGDDKQWAAGDTNPASPFHGNVYAVWDDTDNGQMCFARTLDHGTSWTGTAGQSAGSYITSGTVYPEIDVSSDGIVVVVSTNGGSEMAMMSSIDGCDSFQQTTPPATGITSMSMGAPTIDGWTVLPGGTFRVITDPTACVFGETVMVAWADYREGVSRIYFARSLDLGATWTTGASGQPLLTGSLPGNVHHFHPQIVVDDDGVFACVFYEFGPKPTTSKVDVVVAESFDHGLSFGHFTVTDQPWDPTVGAPWAHGDPNLTFIGDYMGFDASPSGFRPLWTDTRTGVQQLWTTQTPEKGCMFVINRSTLGQDEIDTDRSGSSAPVDDAFRVIVDGFTASALGITGPSSTLTVASPVGGLSVHCTGNSSANGDYGPEVQRFTFFYNLDFGGSDTAFGFTTPTKTLTFVASIGPATAEGQIELIKQPDPFMLHGNPAWLSVDLRVFVMRPGDKKFGVTMGNNASDAPTFIQSLMHALTQGNGTAAGKSFDDESVLSSDEEGSALFTQPTDGSGTKVFNFALARVRYKGTIGAPNVRAFFRLFNAQTTTSTFDFPPGQQYRRATSNPDGQPIPLAGVAAGEYTTFPFFSRPRINTTTKTMSKQTDSSLGAGKQGNLVSIAAHGDGSEVDTFFGCWLDINQPVQSNGTTPNNVLPLHAKAPLDGPYNDPGNPPKPIGQAVLRNLHQCLIVEVAFDPIAIPIGADSSDWDKLAQRNISWSDVGSAQAVSTFEIRPTATPLVGTLPDELMIDWGNTPNTGEAEVFLPGVSADAVLSMAARMYTSHGLEKVDDHTIACATRGVTYLPIPEGGPANLAGLLTVTPPADLKQGEVFTIVVRQITNAFGVQRKATNRRRKAATTKPAQGAELGVAAQEPGRTSVGELGGVTDDRFEWRKVVGAFQLSVPVHAKSSLLEPEERNLSVLRWIGEAIPRRSRWHPVFARYLEVIGARVTTFGGDPGKVLPSPWGTGGSAGKPGKPGTPGSGGGTGVGTFPGAGSTGAGILGDEFGVEFVGKVVNLAFDRYGDFEGFVLYTAHGDHFFASRQGDIAILVERAWRERLLISVWARPAELHVPESIMIKEPPSTF